MRTKPSAFIVAGALFAAAFAATCCSTVWADDPDTEALSGTAALARVPGPVRVRLTVRGASDPRQVQEALSAIGELTGSDGSRDRDGDSYVFSFAANGWSPRIPLLERAARIGALKSTWGDDLKIEFAGAAALPDSRRLNASVAQAAAVIPASLAHDPDGTAADRVFGGSAASGDGSGKIAYVRFGGLPSGGRVTPARSAQSSAGQASQGTAPTKPPLKVFNTADMDKSVSPCEDFYQYSCGGWLKNNPVPADQPQWNRFSELFERNRDTLVAILYKAAAGGKGRTSNAQKIGDYFSSCKDQKTIEKKGLEPLRPVFSRIDGMRSKADLPRTIVPLLEEGIPAFLRFGSDRDFKDSNKTIAFADQGGFSLPDREYYLTDEESKAERLKDKKPERSADENQKYGEYRAKYAVHLQKIFGLLGESADAAKAHAAVVVSIEHDLAKNSMGRTERRQPANVYHVETLKAFEGSVPSFNWKKFLSAAKAPEFETLNVVDPGFFQGLDGVIGKYSLDDWKTYLRWQAVHASFLFLPKAYLDETFSFFYTTLAGQQQLKPRERTCASFVDSNLGEALGREYVKTAFGPEDKERNLKMMKEIEAAMGKDIQALPWMDDATRAKALEKLAAILNRFGYPDKWRDYSKLKIVRGDALGNYFRANAFEAKRNRGKIGRPTDKAEWGMTPPTVNAFALWQNPSMDFAAGILQPPFYDRNSDLAGNFGAIGSVEGHELTHHFDDVGGQYDLHGNLNDWWSKESADSFKTLTGAIRDEYSQFPIFPGALDSPKLNGQLTLGENTADNGGIRLAYAALQAALAGGEQKRDPVEGFTPEQRFFISYGQVWCENRTPDFARQLVASDPHSPGRYRVNGVVTNMPEFQQAFACKAGDPMAPEKRNRVW